jgi:hypothetical protein
MAGYLVNPGDHIDIPLSNYLAMYRPVGSIADQVSPIVPVRRRTDKFYTWDKASLLGDGAADTRRARGAAPRVIEPTQSVSGFLAVEHELAVMIEDGDIANTDSVVRLEQTKVQFLADRIRMQREFRVAAQLRFQASGGQIPAAQGTTNSGVTQWNNGSFVATNLIAQIATGIEAVRTATGYKPNTIVIPAAAAAVAVQNSNIQALIQYVAGPNYLREFQIQGGGTSDAGAEGSPSQAGADYRYFPDTFLGLKVYEPGMVYNSAAEGATGSYGDIWGKDVRIMYVNPNPPVAEIPSAMYTFRSTEYGTAGWNVRRWRDEGAKANMYGVGVVETDLMVATDLVYVIANAVA